MTHFLTEAIFDATPEKRTYSMKQSTGNLAARFTEYVNARNEKLVAAEVLKYPEKAGNKPAKLDESAIVEKVLDAMFKADPGFQHYLAKNEIILEPTPAVPAKPKK